MTRALLGRVLIWMGVLAWVPYFGAQWLMDLEPPMWPFLTVHLVGVLGGGYLRGSTLLKRLLRRE